MNARSRQRMIAGFGILGLVLAQFAVTAGACAVGAPARASIAAAFTGPAGSVIATAPDNAAEACAGHVSVPGVASNLCQVHCTDAATPAVPLDLPQVALAPLLFVDIPVAALAACTAAAGLRPLPFAGGAPPTLRFCRLLI